MFMPYGVNHYHSGDFILSFITEQNDYVGNSHYHNHDEIGQPMGFHIH